MDRCHVRITVGIIVRIIRLVVVVMFNCQLME